MPGCGACAEGGLSYTGISVLCPLRRLAYWREVLEPHSGGPAGIALKERVQGTRTRHRLPRTENNEPTNLGTDLRDRKASTGLAP